MKPGDKATLTSCANQLTDMVLKGEIDKDKLDNIIATLRTISGEFRTSWDAAQDESARLGK